MIRKFCIPENQTQIFENLRLFQNYKNELMSIKTKTLAFRGIKKTQRPHFRCNKRQGV